jgi:prepilin-type N-terminal cleavage/methylation domain-containing protein
MKTYAFTLIEVLLAMTIFTSCVFIIANLQSRALNKVLLERDQIERVFLLKRDACVAFITPPENEKKNVNRLENPDVTFTTYVLAIQPKSILKDLKDILYLLKAEAAWKKDAVYHEYAMISIVGNPIKQEQEKKQ